MLLLPWKTLWDVPIPPVPPLPLAELFSSEENEKQTKEYVENNSCDPPLKVVYLEIGMTKIS